ncbi:MAG TPA: TonB-dependent receptor plug domain-containing protein [Opitutus sp.]|nr:TonB-dependent receptor plug domain-containing protein [Opitutus sp.]
MNCPKRYAVATLSLVAAFVSRPTTSVAQTAPDNSATSPDLNDSETIVLSPFTVSASEDEGKYRASATLAGARVRTELKDIASPLSVVTSQFLQDTGSHNNMDLLTYTTSTEVGGLYGNWGGFGNAQGISDRSALLSPNTNTRVRGLDAADNTRNFFITDIPWDSYNTERVEIQRGPNSILFGVGSPAGIINQDSIQARFDGNKGKVENEFSTYNSVRWVGDYNLVLVKDLLAIRFAGLLSNQKYRQEPAFNDEKRGYVTATFQPQLFPKEWAGRLDVRASYENAKITANRPRILPPIDAISLWFDDTNGDGVNNKIGFGKQVYDMFLWSNAGGGDPYRNPAGVTFSGLPDYVINPLPYQPGMSSFDGGALNNGGIGFFFKNGDSRPFFVSRQAPRAFPGALDTNGVPGNNPVGIPYGSPLRVGGLNAYALSMDQIAQTEGTASLYPLATRGYYKDQTLSDPTIFNFYDDLIDGNNKRERQRWDATDVSVSQTFLDNRLGLEFVYDKQNYSQWRDGATWDQPYISIDVNKNLQNQLTQYDAVDANGQVDPANGLLDTTTYRAYGFTPTAAQPYANPMAGAAFTAGNFSHNNRSDRSHENFRLTAVAELRADDFLNRESLLTRILGRHTFTGLLSREKRYDAETEWAPSAVPYDWAYSLSISGEDTNLTGATRGITPIIYLSDPLFDKSSAHGLNLGPVQVSYNPSGVYSVDYFKTQWLPSRDPSAAGYVDPAADWVTLLGSLATQSQNPFNYTGRTNAQVSILNADAGDRSQLVTNYGVTEQTIDSRSLVWQGHLFGGNIVPTVGWRTDDLATYTATGAKDATGISATEVGSTTKVLDNKGRTTTWGIVAHMPASWLKNVPIISGISAYYNHGENNRVEARLNYDGEPLDNPSATSKDYGIVVSAFDDKLNIKVGKFITKVKNANLPGGANLLGSNEYYLYQLEAWGTANTLLYAFGMSGLDPNQNWHWDWAWVDAGFPGNTTLTDPTSPEFKSSASTAAELKAMDDWMATIDAQFFKNYDIPADVTALQGAYATWRSSGNIQPLIDAAKASGFAVGTYTTGFSSQNNGQINGIYPNGTIDNTSEGYEIEVNYTPTAAWNIQLNASKTNAYRESLGQPMLDFINKQWAQLQGPAGDIRLWWGGDNTLRQYYSDNIMSAVLFQQESIGFQVPELRPWHYDAITNYSFKDGWLKGFNVGGAWRYDDRQILGYGLKDDQSGLDVHKPIFGGSENHLDLWIGYQHKLRRDLTWRIQLNLRNVGESVGLIPISVNPDGTVAAQRIAEGMSWTVRNSFSY